MGCGKSKHDVVTGNTTKVKKPSEPESVKGKENETIKSQECCRCRKKNEISAVVSGDQPETTVETDTKKSEEKEDRGDCGEKISVEMKNGDIKPEEKETTTTSQPVTAILPENIVTEETVNDVKESVLPIDEQKEETGMETVVEEEQRLEDKNDDVVDVDTNIQSPEVEEPVLDEQTPTIESEVQEISTTKIDEIAAEENDEIETKIDETAVAEEIANQNDEIAATKVEEIVKENDEIAVEENEEIAAEENEEIAVEVNEEIIKQNDEIAAAEHEEIVKEMMKSQPQMLQLMR